jgi:hypothetical protein
MASPHFNLWDKTMPPIEEPHFPTAEEAAEKELEPEPNTVFGRRRLDLRQCWGGMIVFDCYYNQYPPKPMRFSKSGVPLVQEKE